MRNNNILFFSFVIFFSLLITILSKEDETILFAFQMNRHGARAPYDRINNGKDIFHEEWGKKKELSPVGKRQLYLLGAKVRNRYIKKYKLLSEQYNPQEIYIKCTDSNRTIESTYSFIQGLYPTGTGQKISNKVLNNKEITYPPNKKYQKEFDDILKKYHLNESPSSLPNNMEIMPIHIFYVPAHDFELYDSEICKGLVQKYEKQNNRKEIKDFVDGIMKDNNNKELIINLEKDSTGKTVDETFLYDYRKSQVQIFKDIFFPMKYKDVKQ